MGPIINKSRIKYINFCSTIINELTRILTPESYLVLERRKRKHLKLLLKNIQRKRSYLQSFDEKADNYILTCKNSDLVKIMRFLTFFDSKNFLIEENNDGSFTYYFKGPEDTFEIINYNLSNENRNEIKSMFVVDIETSDTDDDNDDTKPWNLRT